MKRAFIIHGSHGNPQENWFPWLKSELEKLNYKVTIPQFPAANNTGSENLDDWLKMFEKYLELFDENSILIAHSKGCIFTYHLLHRIRPCIRAVFLVAPWYKYHWYGNNKPVSTFHVKDFRWDSLKDKSKYFEIYQSTNDIIEVWEGEKIAKDVGGNIVIIENAGHFNSNAGFTKFPLLLESIKNKTSI